MTELIIMAVALVAAGGYIMWLHREIHIRDHILLGIATGEIKIIDMEDLNDD